jgi:DNA-directed RNA polymerase II subunit RPB2
MEEITQEDCWIVISSFFDDKGLVRQQLDSFDEFVKNTIQEIVDETEELILESPAAYGAEEEVNTRFIIKFGQIYVSKPTVIEADGSTTIMFPQEARLRNLTYSGPLYVDMKKEIRIADPNSIENQGITDPNEMTWEVQDGDEDYQKVFIGKLPIMLKSSYCQLNGLGEKDMFAVGECPYDQVLCKILNVQGWLFYNKWL